jgi:hypothetical protein
MCIEQWCKTPRALHTPVEARTEARTMGGTSYGPTKACLPIGDDGDEDYMRFQRLLWRDSRSRLLKQVSEATTLTYNRVGVAIAV